MKLSLYSSKKAILMANKQSQGRYALLNAFINEMMTSSSTLPIGAHYTLDHGVVIQTIAEPKPWR